MGDIILMFLDGGGVGKYNLKKVHRDITLPKGKN